jgi:histidyl-tRNA synthetase
MDRQKPLTLSSLVDLMPANDTPKRAIANPRGTKDLGVKEAIALKEASSIIEEIFKRFGFSPIDTPAIENLDVINAKAYGDEPTKEIFVMEGGDSGLRYDFTVPLARYMAMNKDISLPFKRYQIGKLWRKDEPQFMRSREFMQADIDIVGSAEIESDAEVLAATAAAIEALGITNYTILLNHREMLNSILTAFGVQKEKHLVAIRILDKLSKQSVDETIKQLVAAGIAQQSADKLLSFIDQELDNGEKLNKLQANSEASKQNIEDANRLIALLKQYGIKGEVTIDFSLARGLDYYTGFIWEFSATEGGKRLPSIAGGGRYDNLITMFSKTSMPAVGCSIGVSRILEMLKGSNTIKSYVRVFVAQIGDANKEYAFNICRVLRLSGIYTDINMTKRSISKQLEFANSIGAKYAVIVGDQERTSNKAKVRDMTTGTEELLDLNALLSKLKSA